MAGEPQEHVVQGRAAQRDVLHRHPLGLEPAGDGAQRGDPVGDGGGDGALLGEHLGLAGGHAGERRGHPRQVGPGCGHDLDLVAADGALELGGGAGGDGAAAVDDGDPVGELVGLLEVLRGQQHRRPARDQVADRGPDLVPAARVEPGGRLVEEQHLRGQDHARRQVEPAAHAAAVALHALVAGVGEVEPLQQLGRPQLRPAPAEVEEHPEQLEVLPAGEDLVDRGVLAGQADPAPYLLRVPRDVDPGDVRRAAVGLAAAW